MSSLCYSGFFSSFPPLFKDMLVLNECKCKSIVCSCLSQSVSPVIKEQLSRVGVCQTHFSSYDKLKWDTNPPSQYGFDNINYLNAILLAIG